VPDGFALPVSLKRVPHLNDPPRGGGQGRQVPANPTQSRDQTEHSAGGDLHLRSGAVLAPGLDPGVDLIAHRSGQTVPPERKGGDQFKLGLAVALGNAEEVTTPTGIEGLEPRDQRGRGIDDCRMNRSLALAALL